MIDFDVETSSLQHHGAAGSCRVGLAQFGDDDTDEPVIAWREGSIAPEPDADQVIETWLARRGEGFRAHNSKFDLHCLRQNGFELPPDELWHDNQVAAHIIDERFSTALQARADKLFGPEEAGAHHEAALKQWLNEERKRRRDASKGPTKKDPDRVAHEYIEPTYLDVPEEIMAPYAANDIVQTQAMGAIYYPQVEANPHFKALYDLEMRVMRALFWAEDRGIPVDREAMVNCEAQILPRLDAFEEEAIRIADFDGFNPRSPKQVGEALERLNADISAMDRAPKTKQLVVDEENLSACDHPLAEAILRYRGEEGIFKWLNGALHVGSGDGKFPHAYLTGEDRLHPNFRQLGARTGRMSCSNPNFQNVPRDDLRLRYAIKADPGHKLVTCDLDSIEMRLLAALAGPGALLDAIQRGDDIHTMTAERVGLTGRKRSTGAFESARDQGKRMNYLIIYGGGLRAIRKWFGVDQARARLIYESMQRAYPEIAGLQARIEAKLEDRGYLESPLTKRRWRMYGQGYGAVKKEGYRFINYLIQGTAADIIKIATARVHEAGVPIIGVVHDEILAHVPAEDAEEAGHIIVNAMTKDFPLLADGRPMEEIVPITADAQIVDRWSQAKKADYVPDYMEAAA